MVKSSVPHSPQAKNNQKAIRPYLFHSSDFKTHAPELEGTMTRIKAHVFGVLGFVDP